ncbi:MAG: hypothetical protein KAI81_09555, partial [Candidatus Marinimicrobia bacterium]|nr:hypothetical protein [Candidatus Neomarinimicrobiota bacterium]
DLYVDPMENIWIGYNSEPAIISVGSFDTGFKHFDFSFSSIIDFCGDSLNTFVIFKKDFLYGIAHFIRSGDKIVFKDFYDQFSSTIKRLNVINLLNDTLYVGTDNGLWVADINNSNMKPVSAWENLIDGAYISTLQIINKELYFNLDNSLYRLNKDGISKEALYVWNSYPIKIIDIKGQTFLANNESIYKKRTDGSWEFFLSAGQKINDFIELNNEIFVSLKNEGFIRFDLEGQKIESLIPNSPYPTSYYAIDFHPDHGLIVASNRGFHILSSDLLWHNVIQTDRSVSIGNASFEKEYSADSIAYTYFGGTVWDCHISNKEEVYLSFSGVHTDYNKYGSEGYEPMVRPGPLVKVDLNDYANYAVYDTTDDMFDGSEASIAGIDEYIVTRGIAESEDGSIWVANAHASNGEPLVRIYPDGSFEKYSLEGSGNILQTLPNEMTFDDFGRLWIANQYHMDNAPITKGGISIYDLDRDQWFYVNAAMHGLANNDIISICKDPNDGSIWIVTPGGVQMIMPPASINSGNFDEKITSAIQSPLDGISDITVKKVRIDSRSNKWLLSDDGGIRIYKSDATWYNDGLGYTRENSPLLSNTVLDIAFDDASAKVWILTANGLNSFESAWGSKITTSENIIIYPQPFDSKIHHYLYFDNLPDQSDIIISTLNGHSLYKIAANSPSNYGRQVIWNLVENGKVNLNPGVYYAFIYNIDGLRKTLKFAVK